MARLQFGRLKEAWKGEASDFTPLLAEQLDAIGSVIGVDLASIGASEVQTAGGRRIDIVASGTDGSEFVVENQYGRGDHDHLTRGLAYAVARRARGLVVVAEEHRDEFRAVAQYLNDLAEYDAERGIAVWLVEVKAVRIEGSPWAPLFSTVVEPNTFTANVEQAKQTEPKPASVDEFWTQFTSEVTLEAAKKVFAGWQEKGHRWRLGPNHMVLMAEGPSVNGLRTVVALYSDGRVLVPFGSYGGQNSGIPIEPLTTEALSLASLKGPPLLPEAWDHFASASTGRHDDLGGRAVVSSSATPTGCSWWFGRVGEGGLFVLPVGLAFDDEFPCGAFESVDGGLG